MKKFLVVLGLAACSANSSSQVESGVVEGGPTETHTALELEAACAKDDAASCLAVGIRYERGDEGVAHDHDAALERYRKACRLGNATGCYAEALVLLYDRNDPIRAHLLLEHTCKSGHGPSCVTLGDLHRDGKLLGREPQALALYQQACDGGYMNGCSAYIELVWTASEPLVGLETFVAYLGKGCEAGHAMSCEELGKVYETGMQWEGYTVAEDPEKAQAAFAKAAFHRRVAGPRGWWDEVKTSPPTEPAADVADTQSPRDLSKPGYLIVSGTPGTLVINGVDTNIAVPGTVLMQSLGRHVVSVRQANGVQTRPKVVFVTADNGLELTF